MSYLLPAAYPAALAPLCTRAPADGWPAVAAVLEEELGAPLGAVFASLERSPRASASLAQVHLGVLRVSGARVAVKVQHAGLRETSAADIATVRALTRAALPGSVGQCQILPLHLTLGYQTHQSIHASTAARNDHQSTGVLVQAVNNARPGCVPRRCVQGQ